MAEPSPVPPAVAAGPSAATVAAPAGWLPGGCSLERLLGNLAVLEGQQRELVERVRLPVDSDHVRVGPGGRPWLAVEQGVFPLAVPREEAASRAAAVVAGSPRRVVVVGVGLGELVDELLRALPRGSTVVAWERDPWLLRVALARRDWRAALRAGRLRLALLSDLVALAAERGGAPVVEHPLLAGVYAVERRYLRDAGGAGAGGDAPGAAGGRARPARTALVRQGGLYADSLADALRRRGFAVLSFPARGVAVEELELLMRRARPELVASVNYVDGLAELCHAHDARLAVWEIDPTADWPRPPGCPTGHVRFFTYRRAQVAAWRAAGFRHVEHLPLAADDRLRRPAPPAERRPVAAPVAFVGSSLVANAARLGARFDELHVAWRGDADAAAAARVRERVLAGQRADLARWRVPGLLAAAAPGLAAWCRAAGAEDPAILLGEAAAAERRRAWLAPLGRLGLHVWGDPGWEALAATGATYRGPAGHRAELNAIYSAAAVNVDVGRLYQTDMVTLRVFDVLACGGFALVEHSAELEELFAVGEELESFRDADELERKARHFLDRPAEARAIAARGRAAVLARHRFDDRLAHVLATLDAAASPTAAIGIGAGEELPPRIPSHTTGHTGPYHGGSRS